MKGSCVFVIDVSELLLCIAIFKLSHLSTANITIYRNESIVVINALEDGLKNVTYDGETLWVSWSAYHSLVISSQYLLSK